MDNRQIAAEVIEALGGRENVRSVAHCATRLRVMVYDEGKIDKEKAEAIDKVKGAFFNSGQYQMIFGTGTVNNIYDEVVALGLPTSSTSEQKAEAGKQGNLPTGDSYVWRCLCSHYSSYCSNGSLYGGSWFGDPASYYGFIWGA